MKNNYMILTLKKEWFYMILSGEKTEEYREIKPYWEKRFTNYFGKHWEADNVVWNEQPRKILFRNGYGDDKPQFFAGCTIREDYGKEEWGAKKGQKYYVLQIHRIFGERNIKK